MYLFYFFVLSDEEQPIPPRIKISFSFLGLGRMETPNSWDKFILNMCLDQNKLRMFNK